MSEAEDVTQEALLRLTGHDGPIDEPAAWITTVVTRLSINVLKSARVRREAYVGPWLPEPLLEDPGPGPALRAELADSASGELERRRVRVNGQPGRLVRGPAEPELREAGRLATEQALELLKSGDIDTEKFAALAESTRGPAPREDAELRVWSVLTVDVVERRIQTIRVVRNPDKLAHL